MIIAGKPVTGDQLIGRSREIEMINHNLDAGQSIVLIAPRRYGKTSLLLEILRQRKEAGNYTAFVDFFATPDIISLAAEITARVLANRKWNWTVYQIRTQLLELLKNIQFRQVVDRYEFILGFGQTKPDEWELLAESLKLIDTFAIENQKKIVCGFDEFGDLEKLDGEKITKLFRSIIQLQEASVFLFAGSYESVMNRIFVTKSSPFLRFARIIHLGNINRDEFRPHIHKNFNYFQTPNREALTDNILDFTQGHPYYTQLLSQQVVLLQRSITTRELTFDLVKNEALAVENDYLEKLWEAISGNRQQKAVILAIAEGKESLYAEFDRNRINVSRTMKQLAGAGMITTSPSPGLTDPLFRYWIRKRILKME
jgi:AAA+ ATPase superfamily predicted ATPase